MKVPLLDHSGFYRPATACDGAMTPSDARQAALRSR